MSVSDMFPALVLASIVGALVGCLVSIDITRRSLSSILRHQETLSVETITTTINITSQDGKIVMRGKIGTDFHELSARLVEQWLDERGLVMAPKGKDFTAKAPS